ncbi:MAG: cation/multidrug efflux pump [Gammaproteobacteria bacterium]|nr:cation/multidrug efflux pump [Gammaproteobacteria bacterium]
MIEYITLTIVTSFSMGLVYFTYRSLGKKKLTTAGIGILLSIPTIAFTTLLASTIIDDSTIKRLTKEHTIATIEFRNIGNHHYRASFTEPHQLPVEFEIYGDQWQIDARVMKWNGVGAKLGLKPVYQFERLTGRYQDVKQEENERRSVYALSEEISLNSMWDYLNKYQTYIPWLDTQYGSATYMPMKNGAVFTINLSQNGLLARPRNFVASQSIKQWL